MQIDQVSVEFRQLRGRSKCSHALLKLGADIDRPGQNRSQSLDGRCRRDLGIARCELSAHLKGELLDTLGILRHQELAAAAADKHDYQTTNGQDATHG
jgi:hypothetical protein